MILSADELPIEHYHQGVAASDGPWLSKTTLRDFSANGPKWWEMAHILRTVKRPRPGGALQGLALDCLLTEGLEAFGHRFVTRPEDMDGRTKEGKAWAAGSGEWEVLTWEDSQILHDGAQAVFQHPQWPKIQKCRAQTTIRRWSDSLGLGLQSRPDWIDLDNGILYDLKKTSDLEGFGRQAINLGYHLQAAIARWCLAGEGIELRAAYLIAVEWKRGARCRAYPIPEIALADGERQMRATAAEIARRIKASDWIDHAPDSEPLPIPEWMERKMAS